MRRGLRNAALAAAALVAVASCGAIPVTGTETDTVADRSINTTPPGPPQAVRDGPAAPTEPEPPETAARPQPQSGAAADIGGAGAVPSSDRMRSGGDEFNGTTLDRQWIPYPNATLAAGRRGSTAAVSDGELRVAGSGNGPAGVAAKRGRTYGRWEFRVRTDPGDGFTPAIVLRSRAQAGAGGIEIVPGVDGSRRDGSLVLRSGPDSAGARSTFHTDFSRWHTFALEWQADVVALYLDGTQIFSTTDRAVIPSGPMFLALLLDGPDNGRAGGQVGPIGLHVDWVRIYR